MPKRLPICAAVHSAVGNPAAGPKRTTAVADQASLAGASGPACISALKVAARSHAGLPPRWRALGSVKAHGLLGDTVIVKRPNAGQFNVASTLIAGSTQNGLSINFNTFTAQHRLARQQQRKLIWLLLRRPQGVFAGIRP